MTYYANVVNLIGAANRNDVVRRAKNSTLDALRNSLKLCEEIPYPNHKKSNLPFEEIRKILKDVLVERVNYAQCYQGTWRTKPTINLENTTHIVEHRNGFSAYRIPDGEHDAFIEWASMVWEDKNSPKSATETPSEYLERILVDVHLAKDFTHA